MRADKRWAAAPMSRGITHRIARNNHPRDGIVSIILLFRQVQPPINENNDYSRDLLAISCMHLIIEVEDIIDIDR